MQRALLQFFKPEHSFEVRAALLAAGRADLIGAGCDALIPAQPPKAALQARMERAGEALAVGRFVHQVDASGGRPGAGRAADRGDRPPAFGGAAV